MLLSEKLQKLIYVAILVLAAMIKGYIGVHLAKAEQWVFEAVKSTQSTLSYPIPFKEILLAGFFSTNNASGFCEKLSSYNTANATTYQYQGCYGGFLLAIGTV